MYYFSRFNADQNRFSGDIFCKKIDLVGKKHVLGGRLLNLMDVYGSGRFAIDCSEFMFFLCEGPKTDERTDHK